MNYAKILNKIMPVLLALLCLVFCYPILFLLTGSLMGTDELQDYLLPVYAETAKGYVTWRMFPLYPTLKHYVELLLDTPEFFVMFWNSVKLVGGILTGHVLIGVPAAWGFAKYHFPLKRLLFIIYIILMMMPFQVTMLSSYLVLNRFSLINTHGGIILPAVFSTFPVYIMYRFFCQVPDAMMESAQIDGAGPLQIFFHIGIPMGSGGIISVIVLGFLEYWNLIEQPLTFLKSKDLWPLSLYLPEITSANAGIAFVSSVVALIPAIFVFLSGQDYLEQGIVASAIKE